MQEWFVISLPCLLVLTPTPFPNPVPQPLYEPPGCWNNLSTSQYPLRDRVIHSLYQLYVNLTLIIEENKNLITVGDKRTWGHVKCLFRLPQHEQRLWVVELLFTIDTNHHQHIGSCSSILLTHKGTLLDSSLDLRKEVLKVVSYNFDHHQPGKHSGNWKNWVQIETVIT